MTRFHIRQGLSEAAAGLRLHFRKNAYSTLFDQVWEELLVQHQRIEELELNEVRSSAPLPVPDDPKPTQDDQHYLGCGIWFSDTIGCTCPPAESIHGSRS